MEKKSNNVSISDEEIIHLVQKGAIDKFDIFILRYLEEAISFVLRMVKNRADAEDIAQEAFYKFFKNINNFRFESTPKTYFYRILLNTTYNFISKQRVSKIIGLGGNLFGVVNRDGDVSLEGRRMDEAGRIGFRVALDKSLQRLSRREREVLILKHYQGLKINEISAVLKVTPGTVKTLLFRAIHKLAKELGLKKES